MKAKLISVFVVVVLVLSLLVIPSVVASEHNQTKKNKTENVEIGVGQSLSVAVDGVSTEVKNQVSDVARKRALGEASSEEERAKVLSEDLNETSNQARKINRKYQELVKNYKNGDIGRSDLITGVSRLSNEADQVEEDLNSIQYATQFIPESELNRTGVDTEKIDGARQEVGVVGGDVAKTVRNKALEPNSKMNLEANETGIELAIKKSNGRAYNGVDRYEPDHGEFNISADDALQVLADKYEFNASEYEINVEKDDDGYYEVEAENKTVKYEAIIDGRDGSISSFERDIDERDGDDQRGPPENVPDGDEDDRRGPSESVPKGPPEWAQDYDELEIETDGDIKPNSTVTLTVTDKNESAVEKAEVSANGEIVGQTGTNGTIAVQIPDEKEVNIKVKKGDSEGELEYEREREEDEEIEEDDRRGPPEDVPNGEKDENEGEDDKQEDISVNIEDKNGQSVKLSVIGDTSNDGVEGANVRVNDEKVGVTDSEGLISIEIPEDEDAEIVAEKNGEKAKYEIENKENNNKDNKQGSENEEDEEDKKRANKDRSAGR